MNRDRNQICETCVHFDIGRCRLNPPAPNGEGRVEITLPEMTANHGDEQWHLRGGYGPVAFKLIWPGGWPFVGSDDWCGKWSDGSRDFCGRPAEEKRC